MTGKEREIPPPKANPGMRETDDHVAGRSPRGVAHQPTDGLDRGVDDEHLSSASQGARPAKPAPVTDEADR
jgi:hypothetical protein